MGGGQLGARSNVTAYNSCINVKKTKFIKTVIGDIVAHLKPQKNSPFRQTCNECTVSSLQCQ